MAPNETVYRQRLRLFCVQRHCSGVEAGCRLLPTECGRLTVIREVTPSAYATTSALVDQAANWPAVAADRSPTAPIVSVPNSTCPAWHRRLWARIRPWLVITAIYLAFALGLGWLALRAL